MTPLSIQVPFPVFQGRDGQPLENGYVWIGEPNLNPQTNPVVAYYDAALTIVAPQPLRTLNGYISRAGTPAQIYVSGVSFSILVQDSKGSMVYNFPDGTGISPDACGVTYDPPFTGGVPYPVCEKLAQTVSVMDFDAVGDGVTDDTAAIQAAFASVKQTGGTILMPGLFAHASQLVFDTSVEVQDVIFQGTCERNSGFIYTGAAAPTGYAITTGVSATANSGLVSFENLAIYGDGVTEISGLRTYRGSRYSRLDRVQIRNFNGRGWASTGMFLNHHGTVKVLNCASGFYADTFNACSIDNLCIENIETSYSNPNFATEPVCQIQGLGSFIQELSIESCDKAEMLKLTDGITVGNYYSETNNGENLGVGNRDVIMSGESPSILSAIIKPATFNSNTTDFYLLDLDDSTHAYFAGVFQTSISTPTYQKPIRYGTSKNARVIADYPQFDDVGQVNRRTYNAFSGVPATNIQIGRADFVFGLKRAYVSKLLMTKYCLNRDIGRGLEINSSNRYLYIENNVAGALTIAESPHGNKAVCEYTPATASPYSIDQTYALTNNKTYMFVSFNQNVAGADPVMRVVGGAQSFDQGPSSSAGGYRPHTLIQAFTDASALVFYPFLSFTGVGSVRHDMSFIIDIEQFCTDVGCDINDLTALEWEDLIDPAVISDEFKIVYRGTTPTYTGTRGMIVHKYPPAAGNYIGWVCTAAPSTWKEFGDIQP